MPPLEGKSGDATLGLILSHMCQLASDRELQHISSYGENLEAEQAATAKPQATSSVNEQVLRLPILNARMTRKTCPKSGPVPSIMKKGLFQEPPATHKKKR